MPKPNGNGNGNGHANPYRPMLLRVAGVHDETADVRTLWLEFIDAQEGKAFDFGPGQFGEYSVFGAGECVFTLANSPTRGGHVECTFRAVGKITNALRKVSLGSIVGFRGPYGKPFDTDSWRGRDLVFIGGGIGMAALRAPLQYVLDKRSDYGQITILNGARSVGDICYKDEMLEWQAIPNVSLVQTVDPGGETPDWKGEVGLIPHVFEKLALKPDGRVAIVCGPPIMVNFMFQSLEKLGYKTDQVVTTLENKMKCGLGLCGRCNIGDSFVCTDGPVYTWEQVKALPKDF